LLSTNNSFTVAIFFCFAACFITIGLWITVLGAEGDGDMRSDRDTMDESKERMQEKE
jgi:hypothetical protein